MNRGLRMAAASYSSDVLERYNGPIDEAIQSLPTEIREKIYKELVRIKMRERKEMGWKELHYKIEETPFCEKLQRITKVCYCRKCTTSCYINGLCYECLKKGQNHYLDFSNPTFETYNENFQKFY